MRIGIVSPYSYDAPGGVQFHIRDLAEELIKRGHYVNVLAPAEETTKLPKYVTSGGSAVPVKYNGSVARLCFGPQAAANTKKWLAEHQFDLIHVHEPITPSLSMLAVWNTTVPVVATFHSNLTRSRILRLASGLLKNTLAKIDYRIAVSAAAQTSLRKHLGIDAQIIPNGVTEINYSSAITKKQWTGTLPDQPVIAFLGRLDEPRKGLPVLSTAIPKILSQYPATKFIIAGPGEKGKAEAIRKLGAAAKAVTFLGIISESEKAQLLKSVSLYVAPQTGGESFGIVLIEAMSAGTPVVASDLPAFSAVLANGEAGTLFPVGDATALADAVISLISRPDERKRQTSCAQNWVQQFDWEHVTNRILAVYQSILSADQKPTANP